MKSHDYQPRRVKIIARELLTDDTVALRLEFLDKKPLSFTPGQFVLFSVLGFGEVPVGITSSPKEKNFIEVAIRSVGMVTQKIWQLQVGDLAGINGPLGNGFDMAKIKGKDVVLVAGGLGLVPLRSLIKYIEKDPKFIRSLTILLGAKDPQSHLFKNERAGWQKFAKVGLTVDRCDTTWKECVGNITKLFDKFEVAPGSVMIVCGPTVMFQPVIKRYAGKRIAEKDLYLLLERRMKCGVGKCQHCTCGQEYVCLDGPVFSYERLKYNQEAFA